MSVHDQPTQVLYPNRPPRAEETPQPTRTRRGFGFGFLLRLLLVLIAIPLAVLAVALVLTPPRETVLILGTDARPDELARNEIGRTDTLLVFVADRAQPKVAMVSVPRDLWVPIPGHGEERINTAYQQGGAQTAKQTVSNALGIRVDRYALIGLQGVRDIVDAVGGVDITVEQTIHDDAYPTDDYGTISITIPAGRQHMDGETALRYARTRHQDSDFGRIARQQRVLNGVRAALMNPLNWPRIPATVAAIQRSVKTDVSPFDAAAIGAALLRSPGDPERLVIDTDLVEPFTGAGGAFLLSPKPELQRTVGGFLGAHTAAVEVLNGAGVSGIARRTADRLAAQDIQVAQVGDAEARQTETLVLTRPETHPAAEAVARVLGLPTSRVSVSQNLPAGIDVRVVVGSDLAS